MSQVNSNGNNSSSAVTSNANWKPEEVPQLTVDVYRDSDNIFVVSTVAGVNPKDLDISVENNTLSIKGVRRKPYASDGITILLEECFWGEFYRELTINENLDIDKITASINQGVLIIQIPILRISSHRKIVVDLNQS
ncbi:MAG: Hsp20/alpha crystallin family protein [Patescibacteria group bacterium]